MTLDGDVPETRGVTVQHLASVDLGPEIAGMAGRELRMRIVTIEPGGVLGPVHDHADRPGVVYILQGTITDHRDGGGSGVRAGCGLARGQEHVALAREHRDYAGDRDLSRCLPAGLAAL